MRDDREPVPLRPRGARRRWINRMLRRRNRDAVLIDNLLLFGWDEQRCLELRRLAS